MLVRRAADLPDNSVIISVNECCNCSIVFTILVSLPVVVGKFQPARTACAMMLSRICAAFVLTIIAICVGDAAAFADGTGLVWCIIYIFVCVYVIEK